MNKTYLISLLAAAVVVAVIARSLERTSRTQQKGGDELITQTTNDRWMLLSNGVGDYFRDFHFLDEDHGWGVTKHSLWKTDNGGRNWTEIRTASTVKLLEHYEPQETLERVQFLTRSEGWVVEGSYLIHTTDGGASWQKHKPDNVLVRSFRFLNSENGWLVGQWLQLPTKSEEVETWHPVIYATKDGGKNWRRLFTGPEDHYPLWDVWPISSKDIWAVGFSILHSDDGGASWDKVNIKDWQGVSGIPGEVRFLDSNTGWIKTNETAGGYLLTNDGGKTWEQRPIPADTDFIDDVLYVTSTEAFVVAGNIYRSTDRGKSWVEVTEGDYSAIEYLKDQDILFAAGKDIAKYKRHGGFNRGP